MVFGLISMGLLAGVAVGWIAAQNWYLVDVELQRGHTELARKESGKLSRIIHRQRLEISKLKDRLKAVSINAAVTANKSATRPNLPH